MQLKTAAATVILIPMLALAALASDDSSKTKKLTVNQELALSVVGKLIDPSAVQTDFVTVDVLLKELYSLQDHWRKRETSNVALAEGASGGRYVQGVYQGFMLGVAAEDSHKKPKPGAPLCSKPETNLKTLVESAIKGLERIPEKQRKDDMASHAIIIQFLEDNLYGECLKP